MNRATGAQPSADAPQQPKSARWLLQQLVAPKIPADFTIPTTDFVCGAHCACLCGLSAACYAGRTGHSCCIHWFLGDAFASGRISRGLHLAAALATPNAVCVRLFQVLMNKKNQPVAWAGMSKDGALVRRQQPSSAIVLGAFRKHTLPHPNNINKFVAVVQYEDGAHRTLDDEAFGTTMAAFEAGVEGSVAMTQYVHSKGGDGSMFRCDYVVPDASDPRPLLAVHKHVKHFLNVTAEEMAEGVTRSFQDAVNTRCEHYTRMVVQYLETVSKYTVLRLVCDFVVDERDQPVLLWLDQAIVVPRAVHRPYAGDEDASMYAARDSTFVDQMSRRMLESKSMGPEDVYAQYDELVDRTVGHGWRGSVLLVDSDAPAIVPAVDALADEGYVITVVADGPAALNRSRDERYSVILIARDLPSLSGIEVTRIIRQREMAFETGDGGTPQRTPILAFTEHTTPDDLRVYMEVGMDGCISKPLELASLLTIVSRAVPAINAEPPQGWHQQQPMQGRPGVRAPGPGAGPGDMQSPYAEQPTMREHSKPRQQHGRSRKAGAQQTGKSSTATLKSSVKPPLRSSTMDTVPTPEDDSVASGLFQLDAETAIPYVVMGRPIEGTPVFHFVVIQDIFDTCEVYQIFFRKIVSKYPGMRVLLYNQPGQAFTEWRKDAVLNNEYQAGLLQALLGHLASTGEFALEDGMAPFYLLGVGNGGCVASYFASSYMGRFPNLRGLLLVNGFLYLDAHLAGVFHDSMNMFACVPASRADLPVYFFSRYLFSPSYLAKVGAPLALNLYTAVHNPITLEGRIQLCQGALAHTDTRDMIENLSLPIIAVGSAQDGFVKPLHVQALVTCRGGEERSIKRVLSTRRRCCVVWFKAGHALLQEARKPLANLVEQLAVGYHEKNDVAFLPLAPEQPDIASGTRGYAPPGVAGKAAARARQRAADMAKQLGMPTEFDAGMDGLKPGQPTDQAQLYEDKFLNDTMSTLRDARKPARPLGARDDMDTVIEDLERQKHVIDGKTRVEDGTTSLGKAGVPGANMRGMDDYNAMAATQYQHADAMQSTSYPAALHDAPPMPAELAEYARAAARGEKPQRRQGKQPYTGIGYDKPSAKPELSRRQQMAKAQAARAEARQMNLSMNLDPHFQAFEQRDKLGSTGKAAVAAGHAEVREHMAWRLKRNKALYTRIVEQVKKIQRAWRAYMGRTLVERMRQQRAALNMQRWWRGCMGRTIAARKRRELWASRVIQRAYRGFVGRALAYRLQLEASSALRIQKSWRGWRARRFVEMLRRARSAAAIKIQSIWRARMAMQLAWRLRDEHNAAINVQRVWRGYLGRARARRERDKFLFSKSQSQSIEFGRQMLMEHKLHGTKLQSEVAILTKEKIETEEAVETLLQEIATFESGVGALEKEMIDLSRAEAEAAGTLDEEGRLELRQNKMRLDREFGAMLVKIADRREKLSSLERKLQRVDATRTSKKEELQDLERKLVVLLEEQQRELKAIKIRQAKKGERLVEDAVEAVQQQMALGQVGGAAPLQLQNGQAAELAPDGTVVAAGGGGGVHGGGPTPQQRAEANALMSSTETMMKFGFMSMSLTYFSSLNMVRAMRQVGTANTILANPLGQGAPSLLNMSSAQLGTTGDGYQPPLAPGAVPGQENIEVTSWTVGDVANWLDTLSLGQYKDAFADAAVDGAFLFDLTDEDLRNTLGIQHALHRKKILGSISRLGGPARGMDAPMGGQSSGQFGGSAGIPGGLDTASVDTGSVMGGAHGALSPVAGGAAARGAMPDATAGLSLPDMMRCVRHNKGKKLATMLQALPDKPFDPTSVKAQFVPGYGTQYDEITSAQPFHINLGDDHGNTLVIACAQSGQLELLKLLVTKGSNVNHQNSTGRTAMHFSCLYKFTDMSEWLVSPDGGAADDSLMSAEGLTCYDV